MTAAFDSWLQGTAVMFHGECPVCPNGATGFNAICDTEQGMHHEQAKQRVEQDCTGNRVCREVSVNCEMNSAETLTLCTFQPTLQTCHE